MFRPNLQARVVAALLFAWEPLNFAVRALLVWPTLAFRSWGASVELGMHGLIAAFCAAAGMMLWNGAPDAQKIAQLAILLSVARVVQSVYWSALPNQTMPGDEWYQAAVAIAVGVVLITVLRRIPGTSSEPPSR